MSHNVQQRSSSICHTWVIISTFSFHGSAISSTSTTDEKICRPTKKGVSSSLIKQHFSSLNHKQSKGKGREVRIFKDPILLRTFWMHNELWIEWIFLKMEEYFVTIFCVTIDDACKVSSMDYKDIDNIVKRTPFFDLLLFCRLLWRCYAHYECRQNCEKWWPSSSSASTLRLSPCFLRISLEDISVVKKHRVRQRLLRSTFSFFKCKFFGVPQCYANLQDTNMWPAQTSENPTRGPFDNKLIKI